MVTVDLRFCPRCESRMKQKTEESTVKCPRCGYSEMNQISVQENEILRSEQLGSTNVSKSSLKVLDSDAPSAMPTTTIQCTKCGNMTAYWWMLQTRSADEATTQFYRCTECDYTWRNYS